MFLIVIGSLDEKGSNYTDLLLIVTLVIITLVLVHFVWIGGFSQDVKDESGKRQENSVLTSLDES
jgi:hypothetical protein